MAALVHQLSRTEKGMVRIKAPEEFLARTIQVTRWLF